MKWIVFPALMSLALGLTFGIASRGHDVFLVYNIVSPILFVTIMGLERVMPRRRDWVGPDGQGWNDVGHMVVGTSLGAALGHYVTELLFAGVALKAAAAVAHPVWPSAWPLALQVAVVFLLADLGRYVQHRLLHVVPFLWRFHLLHHSGARLTVLKTARSHMGERVMQQIFMFGPLGALGAPPRVLLLYIVPNAFLGFFAHANVDVRLGLASYLVMGPEAHRLHHSEDMHEGNTNFGSALVVWDILFGTFSNPRTVAPPARVGVAEDPTPSGFWGQVVAPFVAPSRP